MEADSEMAMGETADKIFNLNYDNILFRDGEYGDGGEAAGAATWG